MAGGLLQYSGLVTKTKAMHGRLLSGEEQIKLSEFEKVEDFIGFLREAQGYAPVYASHEEIAHRGEVETFIHNALYADYVRLYRFANKSAREGLELLFARYEVNVLKQCLWNVLQGGKTYDLGFLRIFFAKHASFDTEALLGAGNMTEFIGALSPTRYGKLLLELQNKAGDQPAVYAAGLDTFYYVQTWKKKDRLSDGGMRKIFTEIIGTEIDWMNILWMYRAKRFFQMKPVDIYAESIPVYYRITGQEYKKLVEAENVEDFILLLGETAYFKGKDATVQLGDEITYRKVMDKTYDRICRKYPASIAPVLRYLYDKENEIDTLTTILEGIRYQIPSREIRQLVIVTG